MAGISLGVLASSASPSGAALQRSPHSTLSATRKRRTHGLCMLGTELATVTSSRTRGDALGVTIALGNGSLSFTTSMTPEQARAVARALHAAALAADGAQRLGGAGQQAAAAQGGAA